MARTLSTTCGLVVMLGALAAAAAAQTPAPAARPMPGPRGARPAAPVPPAVPAIPGAPPTPVAPPLPDAPLAFDGTITLPDLDLALQGVTLPPDIEERVNARIASAMARGQEAMDRAEQQMARAFQDSGTAAPGKIKVQPPQMPQMPQVSVSFNGGAESIYQQARDMIDHERYDTAMKRLNDLLQRFDGRDKAVENRVDAALYWKAYTLGKEQQMSDALATIADMQKRFGDSRWLKDAKALELELRQASGQTVSPDGQSNDELKLLALRGVMRADPDRAIPMVDKLLAGGSSVNVKENALFVLSQSQSPKAKEIVMNTAKSGSNPDLQMRAVRYLGAMGGADTSQTLEDIYKGSTDVSLKRVILRSFMTTNDRVRLAAIARNDASVDLRREAVQDLGSMHATAELRSVYASEKADEVRRAIVNALASQRDAAALVEMARAEKDPSMKKEIVTRLSTMRDKEATDYMLELLK